MMTSGRKFFWSNMGENGNTIHIYQAKLTNVKGVTKKYTVSLDAEAVAELGGAPVVKRDEKNEHKLYIGDTKCRILPGNQVICGKLQIGYVEEEGVRSSPRKSGSASPRKTTPKSTKAGKRRAASPRKSSSRSASSPRKTYNTRARKRRA